MFPFANPNLRGGNDPQRSAVQSVFGNPGMNARPGMGAGPAPQGGGVPAPNSVGEHLAHAYQAFVQNGATPQDQEQVLQFADAIMALGEAPQSQGPSSPSGYGTIPAQAAQGRPSLRGAPTR
jgi:hypothetical protein